MIDMTKAMEKVPSLIKKQIDESMVKVKEVAKEIGVKRASQNIGTGGLPVKRFQNGEDLYLIEEAHRYIGNASFRRIKSYVQ